MDQIALVLALVDRHKGILGRMKKKNKVVDPVWRGTKGRDHFVRWGLANGFDPQLELDRIDPKLGYSPDNCQWITGEENRDKDLVKLYEHEGVKYTLKGYSRIAGCVVSYGTLVLRLHSGWPLNLAMYTPSNRGNKHVRLVK